MKRKICIITGSRAEYGSLYWLMKEIEKDEKLVLQIIATGMHLSHEFGLTYKNIEADGFVINKKIDILLSSDAETAIIKSIGLGCIAFSEALDELKPDIVVLFGDRYELIPAAISAIFLRIPIAHIHGGERSQGVIDEYIRHSITKMAAIHFPATDLYKRRIIQMGENPHFVFNFGALGLDNIYKLRLLNKKELQDFLQFKLDNPTAIVTYHPVTMETNTAEGQIENILAAISETRINAIFTQANADTGGRLINQKIETFCESNPLHYKFLKNLGQVAYFSCLKYLNLMIGNSSSGLIEAPSFKIPVINLGDRQKGRIKAENVIDVGYSIEEIKRGIKKGLSVDFQQKIKNIKNPYIKYKDGRISFRIKEKLKKINISKDFMKKKFFDIYTLIKNE